MLDLQNFISNMTSHAATGQFPVVEFKGNSSMQDIVRRVDGGSNFIDPSYSGPQIVNDILSTVDEGQSDNYVAKKGFIEMDAIADNMTNTLKTTRNELKDIKSIVNRLAGEITEAFAKQLKASPVGNTSLNLVADEGTHSIINWDIAKKLAPMKFIAGEIHDAIRIKGNDPSRMHLTSIVRMIKNPNTALGGDILDLNKSVADREVIAEKLKSSLPNTSHDEIMLVLGFLCDPFQLKKAAPYLIDGLEFNTKRDASETCTNVLAVMDIVVPVVDALESADMSELSKTDISDNANVLYSYLKVGAYFCEVCRKQVFQNAVMLSNGVLNKDVLEAYRKEGGTESDLIVHKHYMYRAGKLPFGGLAMNTVLSFKEKLSVKAKAEMDANSVKTKYATSQVMKSAMTSCLVKYTNSVELKDKRCVSELIRRATEQYMMDTINLEDIMFKFILDLQHRDCFVSLLHERLGASYIAKLAENNELNSTDAVVAEVGVYTKLVVEFMMNKFCV